MEFTVGQIEFGTEDHIAQFFVSEAGDEGHTLEIQASLVDPDESDLRLGMDTYYVCLDEGQAVYGEIGRCEMSLETITLVFSEAAAEKLGIPRVDIRLEGSSESRREVAQQLQMILASGRETELPEFNFSTLES
jgi:hypothetical protein